VAQLIASRPRPLAIVMFNLLPTKSCVVVQEKKKKKIC
jgi:hypothetical protein